MPLFRKKHADDGINGNGRGSFGLGRRQIMPAALMLAAGLAISIVISDIPVGVKQALVVSADASYEEQLYRDFSPADVDVLMEHADVPLSGISVLAGQLYDIRTAVEKTSYDGEAQHVTDVQEEPSVPDSELYIDRSNEHVSSANKNLYRSNYSYGASSLAHSGGAGLNSSGIPMSELALPDSLQFDENGAPLNYSYYIDCYATAYSSGSITSTGTGVYQGCVAVDPREIPYGTEMWIVSLDGQYVYGYCRAEDTGGFIYYTNGATVDLYMYSEADCDEWGFRGARVYILPSSY